jgi:uncharacterized membrane protein YagU involved in acid resistance
MIMAGAYAGLAAGTVLAVAAYIAPKWSAGNYIRELEEPSVFGRKLTRREAHLLGLLLHIIFSTVFGLVFALAVAREWVSGFHLWPLFVYAVILWLFIGLVVMPLQGDGIFGRKHDAWFPVDALLTNVFWALLYLLFIRLWA